uniref:Transmembrane protein n=1 Tax=Macrostomum lignano TaxID=282301 RepID=A0A1I8H7E1_9PLAT
SLFLTAKPEADAPPELLASERQLLPDRSLDSCALSRPEVLKSVPISEPWSECCGDALVRLTEKLCDIDRPKRLLSESLSLRVTLPSCSRAKETLQHFVSCKMAVAQSSPFAGLLRSAVWLVIVWPMLSALQLAIRLMKFGSSRTEEQKTVSCQPNDSATHCWADEAEQEAVKLRVKAGRRCRDALLRVLGESPTSRCRLQQRLLQVHTGSFTRHCCSPAAPLSSVKIPPVGDDFSFARRCSNASATALSKRLELFEPGTVARESDAFTAIASPLCLYVHQEALQSTQKQLESAFKTRSFLFLPLLPTPLPSPPMPPTSVAVRFSFVCRIPLLKLFTVAHKQPIVGAAVAGVGVALGRRHCRCCLLIVSPQSETVSASPGSRDVQHAVTGGAVDAARHKSVHPTEQPQTELDKHAGVAQLLLSEAHRHAAQMGLEAAQHDAECHLHVGEKVHQQVAVDEGHITLRTVVTKRGDAELSLRHVNGQGASQAGVRETAGAPHSDTANQEAANDDTEAAQQVAEVDQRAQLVEIWTGAHHHLQAGGHLQTGAEPQLKGADLLHPSDVLANHQQVAAPLKQRNSSRKSSNKMMNGTSRISKKTLRKQVLLSRLQQLMTSSTAHGMNKLVQSDSNWPMKVAWFAIFICAVCGVTVHTATVIRLYFSYPVSSTVRQQVNGFEFPDVTICDTMLKKFFLYNVSHYDRRTRNQDYSRYSQVVQTMLGYQFGWESKKFLKAIYIASGHKFNMSEVSARAEDFVLYCEFDQKPCGFENFSLYYDREYGNCFTFQPQSRQLEKAGADMGLIMVLYPPSVDANFDEDRIMKTTTGLESKGFQITVHQRDTQPDPHEFGITAPVGMRADFALSQTKIQLANTNTRPCSPAGKQTFWNPFLRTRQEYENRLYNCVDNEDANQIQSVCRCTIEGLIPINEKRLRSADYCHDILDMQRFNETRFRNLSNLVQRIWGRYSEVVKRKYARLIVKVAGSQKKSELKQAAYQWTKYSLYPGCSYAPFARLGESSPDRPPWDQREFTGPRSLQIPAPRGNPGEESTRSPLRYRLIREAFIGEAFIGTKQNNQRLRESRVISLQRAARGRGTAGEGHAQSPAAGQTLLRPPTPKPANRQGRMHYKLKGRCTPCVSVCLLRGQWNVALDLLQFPEPQSFTAFGVTRDFGSARAQQLPQAIRSFPELAERLRNVECANHFSPKQARSDCLNECQYSEYSSAIALAEWPDRSFSSRGSLIRTKKLGSVLADYTRRVANCSPPAALITSLGISNRSVSGCKEDDYPNYDQTPLENTTCGDLQSFVSNTLVQVRVYPKTLTIRMLLEVRSYELEKLFSDIGGILGLWVGISVITIFELAEIAIITAVYLYNLVHAKAGIGDPSAWRLRCGQTSRSSSEPEPHHLPSCNGVPSQQQQQQHPHQDPEPPWLPSISAHGCGGSDSRSVICIKYDFETNLGAKIECSGAKIEFSGAKIECSGAKIECSGAKIECSGAKIECCGAKIECSGAKIECSGAKIECTASTAASASSRFLVRLSACGTAPQASWCRHRASMGPSTAGRQSDRCSNASTAKAAASAVHRQPTSGCVRITPLACCQVPSRTTRVVTLPRGRDSASTESLLGYSTAQPGESSSRRKGGQYEYLWDNLEA